MPIEVDEDIGKIRQTFSDKLDVTPRVFVLCLVFGVWCLVFGVWCLVFGVWCEVFGVRFLVFGVFCFALVLASVFPLAPLTRQCSSLID